MNERNDYHMDPETFRRRGREVVDWIADYMERIETFPVRSNVAPGEIRARLPAEPPETGEPFEAVLRDLDEIILPGITHWQSPNFFAYWPANSSGPAVLGELLSAGLAVQGMSWETSPACTELEIHVLDWMLDMLGLPERFHSSSAGGGVIQDTASSATLCALLAARERATDFVTDRKGCDRSLVAYGSTQAHSSVEKAVRIAGLGSEQLRLIDVDDQYAMDASALERGIETDLDAGLTPCFVTATVGTTSSGAIDPVRAIGEIAKRHRVWLHVDAAMSGTAAICPEFRSVHDGVELADSYCVNPHKWMFTNFDCDLFYVADRATLVRTLSVLPEYLRNRATESGVVIDYRDWHIPLGRRFRALKLWLVIRHYGIEGLRHHVRRHVELARMFTGWVEADRDFELAAPVPLNLVCFRHRGGDTINQAIIDRVNDSGKLFLTHTRLGDWFVLRLAIGQTHTEQRHVQAAWDAIRAAAAEVASE